MTALGSRALQEIQQFRQELWHLVPPNTLRVSGLAYEVAAWQIRQIAPLGPAAADPAASR